MNDLGIRIADLRKINNYTMQELADRCNISKSYINDIEKGRVNPSLDTLTSIAKALNTTVSYLLGEDNNDKSRIVTKAYHNLDTAGLSDEDIKKVEDYIEFLKQKYNPDGTLKKRQ